MAIKSSVEKYPVSWLKREDEEGKLNKNISIQRKEVWDAVKKSNLIVSLLLQYMILRSRPDMGFSGTEIMSYCDDVKNGEAEIAADEVTAVLDYLDAALTEKKKHLKKVHVPVVLFVAQAAKEKEIVPEDFGMRLDAFFENLDPNGEYMAACQSGSAKRINVQLRVKLMSEILDAPIAVIPEKPIDTDASDPVDAKGTNKKAKK